MSLLKKLSVITEHEPSGQTRETPCGRVKVTVSTCNGRRYFEWRVKPDDIEGTAYELRAKYTHASVLPYDPDRCGITDQRKVHKHRARKMVNGYLDGAKTADLLPRKPRRNSTPRARINTPPSAGASKTRLRDALDNRAAGTRYRTAETCLEILHPGVTMKKATADQLYDTLYALAWAQAWGRGLEEWQGMVTGAAA